MKKVMKLGMFVIGMAMVTLVSMPMVYSAVTIGLAGSGADYIDNGSGNNIYAAMNGAAAESDKTLIMLGGTYNFGIVYVTQSGITIKAQMGDTVVINGTLRLWFPTGVTIEGLRINGGGALSAIMLDGAAIASILNNYLTSTSGYGVLSLFQGNVSGTVIDGNVIYSSSGGEGIPVIFGWSTGSSVTIDHNTVFGFTTWGIYLTSATYTATNNLLNVSTSIVSTAGASSSYNAGVPTYGGPAGTGNISVAASPLWFSTNPADVQFLYLACDAPSSVLTGSSTGGVIGALPQVECNEAPVAVCSVGLDADDLLILDGSGSSDSDGTIVAYEWSIDEVVIATTAVVGTEGLEPGIYEATLTVTDNKGATGSCTVNLVKPLGKDPELEACFDALDLLLGPIDCTATDLGLNIIYVAPGTLSNQQGISRNPNALKAVLLP